MQGRRQLPVGIDKNILNEEEINQLLKITSEKSLQKIARETEALAGHGNAQMVRGDMKVSLEEIKDFLQEINGFAPKISRKELKNYLSAFPKQYSNKEIGFLMNGLYSMDANQLFDLISSTQIEEFDPEEEAFKLLDVNNQGFLTIDTFKEIFKNLKLGEIAPSDEDIFKEVADFDKDGVINMEDFKRILSYKPEEEGEGAEGEEEGMEGEEQEEDQDDQ